jgi:hypothetical protein
MWEPLAPHHVLSLEDSPSHKDTISFPTDYQDKVKPHLYSSYELRGEGDHIEMDVSNTTQMGKHIVFPTTYRGQVRDEANDHI